MHRLHHRSLNADQISSESDAFYAFPFNYVFRDEKEEKMMVTSLPVPRGVHDSKIKINRSTTRQEPFDTRTLDRRDNQGNYPVNAHRFADELMTTNLPVSLG